MAVPLPSKTERSPLGSRKVQVKCQECGVLSMPFTVDLCEVKYEDQTAVMWEGINPFPVGWTVYCQDELLNMPVAIVRGYCPQHNKST